jgi:hypothetical protein
MILFIIGFVIGIFSIDFFNHILDDGGKIDKK